MTSSVTVQTREKDSFVFVYDEIPTVFLAKSQTCLNSVLVEMANRITATTVSFFA